MVTPILQENTSAASYALTAGLNRSDCDTMLWWQATITVGKPGPLGSFLEFLSVYSGIDPQASQRISRALWMSLPLNDPMLLKC